MTDTFTNIIARNFNKIQRNFRVGLHKRGYHYDEDILSDALLKCMQTVGDKIMTEAEAITYYWTAYMNCYKNNISKNSKVDLIDECDIDLYQSEDDVYDNSIDEIYDIVISSLKEKYGEHDINIWEMHVCNGMSLEDIDNMGFGHVDNFNYLSKSIKRYIKNHILMENKRLRELLLNIKLN